jgi:FKBP-type peptidyl-prolyl cis-trans isomerase
MKTKLNIALVLSMAFVVMMSSCSSQNELKDFALESVTDSLSYAIGVAASDDLSKAKMPGLNPGEVRVGAQAFMDSTLKYDIKVCYDVYGSIERQFATGQLGVKTTKEDILKEKSDSLSYAVGAMIAANHKRLEMGAINPLAIMAGMQDYIDSSYRIPKEDCIAMYRQAADVSQQRKMEAQQAAMMKEAEGYLPNKEAGEKYLADNATKNGIVTTESGLQYRIVTMGTGPKPSPANTVKVHYTGKTISGEVFDSSVERGEPTSFQVGRVIRGWTEGLTLMPVGSKFEFFIPQELAYGMQKRSDLIVPYSALYFEVELLEIMEPVVQ